jgi:pimeloyl-ACP methyl ester carboxylesterase
MARTSSGRTWKRSSARSPNAAARSRRTSSSARQARGTSTRTDPVETIATPAGRFTALTAGERGAPLVILLHGYPQSRHSWREQVPALGAAGYRAVAPDQRGYSPGVRPDPNDLAHYGIDRLVQDVLDIADAEGGSTARFHLVGHDWGGQVAWITATQHPDRVRSLSVLSRPHPAAFRRAYKEDADNQRYRSRHHKAFHDPNTATMLMENDAARLRTRLAEAGVPASSIDEYVSVLGTSQAMEAALAWYRAAGLIAEMTIGAVTVPTLYVWGEEDASVGRAAAEGTAQYVTGPYRFVPIPRVGHFVTDQVPGHVNTLLLAHLDNVTAARE